MARPKGTPEVYRKRILEYSEPVPESGCWLWMRCLNDKGYGRFYAGLERDERAHRASYRLFKGEIPDGLIVCHRCDVRCCVNPDHLFLGEPRDNTDDMMQKGRHVSQVGEECHKAKLTEDQVREIRALYVPWKMSYPKLAVRYGVGKTTIQAIIERKSWAHIQ